MTADNSGVLARMKARAPAFLGILGGQISAVDVEARTCTLDYNITRDFCHSGDVVQGGFITTMLDSAMSHAVFAHDESIVGLASLEISTRYLDVARAGPLVAVGEVIRASYKTVFLEGRLMSEDGSLLATAQSVARVRRKATA